MSHPTSSPGSKPRILVVEDEAIVARDIQQQLVELGYEPVGHAAQGEQAIVLAGDLRPDLVLMDVHLTGATDGIAAAQVIRERFSLPVVFVTAFAEDDTLARAKLAEPFGYLIKPFAERELRAVIEMALYKHKVDSTLRESESDLREAQAVGGIGSYSLNIPLDVWRSSPTLDTIFGIGAGYPRTTAGWTQLVHPAEREQMASYLRDVIAVHRLFEREYRIVRTTDGAVRWVSGLGRVEYGTDGAPVRLVGTIQDITEHKLADQRLRLSEENLAITLQSIGDAVIATDAAGQITRMNATAERLTGWPQAEARGWSLPYVMRIVDPVTREPATNPVFLALTHATVERGGNETLLLARDGREYQIEHSAAPILDPAGEIAGVVLVFSDVTDAHRVRQELRTTAALLERTSATARVGGWEIDLRSHVRSWSRETCRILELDPLALPALDQGIDFRYYAPTALPVIQAAVKAGIEMGTPFDLELPMITAKGRPIWVRDQGSFVMENGVAISVHGVIQDITDRKAADALLRLESAALAAAANAIVITDRSGVIEWANAAFTTLTGYRVDEAIGGRPSLLKSGMHDEAFYRDLWSTVLSGRAWFGEVINRRKDGSLYTEEMTITPLKDEGGAITNFIAVKHDITKRKTLEEKFRQAQKLESVGRLAGGVAHDFNNMLGVILGNTEFALRRVDVAAPVHADLLEIQKAALRSADLTRQLLAFARKQTIAPRVLDLNETVPGMLVMLRRLLGEDVTLTWLPGPNLWPVKMDPSQMDQILTNLCVNARDAIANVGRLEIETANCPIDAAFCVAHADAVPGDYVRLTVSDTGCGMAPTLLAQIFEPFFTTKGVGVGTGLGLSTVYGALRQNQGFITAASTVGEGTTFALYLPRQKEGGTTPVGGSTPVGGAMSVLGRTTPARGTTTPTVAAAAGGHETLLLVEDEPAILRLASRALEVKGYTVLAANSPGAALAMAAAHDGAIDLLLTDVVMPEMNGRDLAAALGAQQPGLKLLFMSGHTADVISDRGMLEPEVSFLQKPFTIAALAAAVRSALERE